MIADHEAAGLQWQAARVLPVLGRRRMAQTAAHLAPGIQYEREGLFRGVAFDKRGHLHGLLVCHKVRAVVDYFDRHIRAAELPDLFGDARCLMETDVPQHRVGFERVPRLNASERHVYNHHAAQVLWIQAGVCVSDHPADIVSDQTHLLELQLSGEFVNVLCQRRRIITIRRRLRAAHPT